MDKETLLRFKQLEIDVMRLELKHLRRVSELKAQLRKEQLDCEYWMELYLALLAEKMGDD